MSHLLHVFPLINLHELTPVTDAYQWMHTTIWNRLYHVVKDELYKTNRISKG